MIGLLLGRLPLYLWRTNRVKVARHALRGHSVMYRVTVEGGQVSIRGGKTFLAECRFTSGRIRVRDDDGAGQ